MGKSAEELRGEIEDTRGHLGTTLDAIGDRVSPGRMIERKKNRFADSTRSIKHRVMGTVGDAGQSVSDGAHGAMDRLHDGVDSVRTMPDTIKHESQGSPLLAGGIAFGVGFLAAVAFPATRTEKQAAANLMEKAQPITDDVKEAAQEMVQHLKEPAAQAVTEVKTAATDAATHVQEASKDAVHQTKDEVTSVAQDVRSSQGSA